MVRNAEQPDTSPTPRSYAVGLGLRPLGERATVGADYLFTGGTPFEGRLQYTLQAEVYRGLRLSAGFTHGLAPAAEMAFQLGVTLDLGGAGLTYAVGSSPGGLSQEGLLRVSSRSAGDLASAGGTIALFDLRTCSAAAPARSTWWAWAAAATRSSTSPACWRRRSTTRRCAAWC